MQDERRAERRTAHQSPRQVRLLTTHCGLYQLAVAIAGAFVGAYLLRLGYGLPTALVAFAALLALRFAVRFVSLSLVRRFGYRSAFVAGAGLTTLQFPLLIGADRLAWLWAWIILVAVAESLYWPIYHCAFATAGGGERRGRELGLRTAVVAVVGVVGPVCGGVLLARFPPAVDFAVATALMASSLLPLWLLEAIPAGPVPRPRESLELVDRLGTATFAADGYLSSGLVVAWPMVLFASLDSQFEAFGLVNAAAGLAGAATGLVCGRGIDRGHRRRYLILVAVALAVSFALRLGASWSPGAAALANITGAVINGLYGPVLMSVIYDRAKWSGAAYRFHFAAEAGWDAGAGVGCLAAAAVAWGTDVPSLALLPGVLGVPVIYALLKRHRVPSVADRATAGHRAADGDKAELVMRLAAPSRSCCRPTPP
jgi:MFS family permease